MYLRFAAGNRNGASVAAGDRIGERGITIDHRDQQIIKRTAPLLREHGQLLVDLDVIGGKSINITSPNGGRAMPCGSTT